MLNGPSGEERRNKIRCYRLHDYTLNIFNANEAELFFRMASNQTLASAPTSGTKLDRTRITVLLATNAIGTQNSNHLPGCEVIFLSAFLSPNTTAHGCRHYGGSMLPNVTRVYAGACIIKSFKTIVRNLFDELRESRRCEINRYLEMIPTEQPTTDAEIIQLILEEGNEKN
ncbi:unnamed protein product [Rhizophagus irregularis]|nr:unnamed protein product [Rhizophagus irregularis]